MRNDPSAKNWQDEITEALQIAGHSYCTHLAFKYPYIGVPTKMADIPFLAKLGEWYEQQKSKTWGIGRTVSAHDPGNTKSLWLTNAILEETTKRFGQTLLEQLQNQDARPIYVIAHSLGCAVAIRAIEEINKGDVPTPSPIFLRLMAAPFDIDYPLQKLSQRVRYCWIEYSEHDDLWLDIRQAKLFADKIKPSWAGFAALQGFSPKARTGCDNIEQDCLKGFLHGDFVEPVRLLDTWLPNVGSRDKWYPYKHSALEQFYLRSLGPLTRDLVDSYFQGSDITAKQLEFLYQAAEEIVLTGSCSDASVIHEGAFRRITPGGIHAAVAALVTNYFSKIYASLK